MIFNTPQIAGSAETMRGKDFRLIQFFPSSSSYMAPTTTHVIPAKAGIQWLAPAQAALDPGLRRGDVRMYLRLLVPNRMEF
jgi:hypothetical protein